MALKQLMSKFLCLHIPQKVVIKLLDASRQLMMILKYMDNNEMWKTRCGEYAQCKMAHLCMQVGRGSSKTMGQT